MVRGLVVLVLVAALSGAGLLSKSPGLVGRVYHAKGKTVAGAWVEARRTEHSTLVAADFEGAPFRSMRTSVVGAGLFPSWAGATGS